MEKEILLFIFLQIENAPEDLMYIHPCSQPLWELCILVAETEVSETDLHFCFWLLSVPLLSH